MKPLSIADYLDRLGSATGENAPPRREGSPFRPRSLPGPRNGKPALKPVFNGEPKTGGADQTPSEDAPRRSAWAPKPVPLQAAARESPPTEELTSPMTSRRRSTTLMPAAASRVSRKAVSRLLTATRPSSPPHGSRRRLEQQELRLSEYAELEASIRSGFKQVEDNIGGAVARILAPFLSQEVVKRAVNELAKATARLSAGSPPGLIKIRGPERVLALLRERIAGLPLEVEYVTDGAVETVVEANATQIVAALGPWAQLLSAFEA